MCIEEINIHFRKHNGEIFDRDPVNISGYTTQEINDICFGYCDRENVPVLCTAEVLGVGEYVWGKAIREMRGEY